MTKVDFVLPQGAFKCNNVAEEPRMPSVADIVNSGTPVSVKNKCKKTKIFKVGPRNSVHSSSGPSKKSPASPMIRKKNKNRRKRKWKPHCKLNWVVRKQKEDKDSRRAKRRRPEMSSYGLTLAPYNTTQFLMEDHNVQEPDYIKMCNGHHHRRHSNSLDSSDEFYSSPEDEEEFLQRQFVQTYEDLHAERLETISKNDLVEEIVNKEDRVEELEKTLQEVRLHKTSDRTHIRPPGFDVAAELEKIRVYREEIEKLILENDILERENETLRLGLSRKT